MRKKEIILLICSGLMLTSCKKYLDKEPDNRTQPKTKDQISQLLTNAYPKANYILFCESMSDNAEDKDGSGTGYDYVDRVNSQAYKYEEIQAGPDDLDSPDFYWNACYKAIAQANLALEIIDNNATNKSSLNPQRGEALLARAYAHFMLVTFFAKAYDETSAATDPGVPYLTLPEKVVLAQYERKTVAYVYKMIEKDLQEGYPLIDDKIYGESPKFHFNKLAAAAFATRFYMFKKDYNKAVLYAGQALTGAIADNLRDWNSPTVPGPGGLATFQYYDLQAAYTKADIRANLLLQEANSVWGRGYASLRYGIGESILNKFLYGENVTGSYYAYTVYGTPAVYNIPKFSEFFVKESLSASSGNPYNTIPLFTAEEVVLNRAEAYERIGNRQAAITDLNAFISKNISQYTESDNVTPKKIVDFYHSPNDTSLAIITTALDFKRAFFLHEGMRWLDILRLKIPIVHTTASGQVIRLEPNDKRRSLQLPVLTKQAGLKPNER